MILLCLVPIQRPAERRAFLFLCLVHRPFRWQSPPLFALLCVISLMGLGLAHDQCAWQADWSAWCRAGSAGILKHWRCWRCGAWPGRWRSNIASIRSRLGLLQVEWGLQDHFDHRALGQSDLVTAFQQDLSQTQSSTQACTRQDANSNVLN